MLIIRSNRLESFVDTIVDRLRHDPLPPLTPETFVVPSAAFSRWLNLALTERLGVLALPGFVFPRKAVSDLVARVLGEPVSAGAAFETDALSWSIAQILLEDRDKDYLATFQPYLQHEEATRLLSLSAQIAKTFDRYIVYRPELVSQWDKGQHPDWQATLFRRLVQKHGRTYLPARIQRMGRAPVSPIAGRVTIVGVDHMPPVFVHAFEIASRHLDVTLCALGPTPDYWEDLGSPRQPPAADQLSLAFESESTQTATAPPVQHPLLASWGQMHRQTDRQLSALDTAQVTETHFRPTADNNLGKLQGSLFSLDPSVDLGPADKDPSLQVHHCTHPHREAQVLYDRVVDLLAGDDTLHPRDVLILAPDIEAFAPALMAAFEHDEARPSIPIDVVTQSQLSNDVRAVAGLLDLIVGRATVPEVLDMLGSGVVSEAFALGEDEIRIVKPWIQQAGIVWGRDGAHRRDLELPEDDRHTWAAGISRIVLGYALGQSPPIPFESTVATAPCEQDELALISKVWSFVQALGHQASRFSRTHSLKSWRTLMIDALSTLTGQTPRARRALQAVTEALHDLVRAAELGRFEQQLLAREAIFELQSRVAQFGDTEAGAFDGVRCASLGPGSALPARIVCVAGLGEASFPAAETRPSFDLSQKSGVPSDLAARDRQLGALLNATLSARSALVLTHSGAASIAVSELCTWFESNAQKASLPVIHPQHRQSHQSAIEVLDPTPTTLPEPDAHTLDIDTFCEWLWHPVRALHRQRLNLRMFDVEQEDGLYEPTSPSYLDRWRAGSIALDLSLGFGGDQAQAFLQATPLVPAAPLGTHVVTKLQRQAGQAAGIHQQLSRGQPLSQRQLSATIKGVTIEGEAPSIDDTRLLAVQFSRTGGRGELNLWVRHLLSCQTEPETRSVLIARSADTSAMVTVELSPVPDAHLFLTDLVELYNEAVVAPLPLAPNAARAFAEASLAKRSTQPMFNARRAFFDAYGDSRDLYLRSEFGADPLADPHWQQRFVELSTRLYAPLFSHRSLK